MIYISKPDNEHNKSVAKQTDCEYFIMLIHIFHAWEHIPPISLDLKVQDRQLQFGTTQL